MTNVKNHTKRWLCGMLFLVASLLLTSCIGIGVPKTVTKEMDFADFDTLQVTDAFTAHITQGDAYKVTIEVDEQSLPYLDVNKSGHTLKIGMLPRPFFFIWSLGARSILRAEVTMPKLVGVTEHNAAHVDVSGFRSEEETRFELTDASTLEGDIATGDAHFSAEDASTIDLEGNRHNVDITARNASHVTLKGDGANVTITATDASPVDLTDFTSKDVTIKATDASHVTVNASGTLKADAQDASIITYYGKPTLGDTHTSDSSKIEAQD